MTYSQWLETLISPITAFLNWATTLTNSLLNNYVFLTVVGLSVMSSLLYLFFDYFLTLGNNRATKKHNLDNGGRKQ